MAAMETMPALPDLDRARPFQATTDPRLLWHGGPYGPALESLRAGVHAGVDVLLLTGDVGTGKTILANALAAQLRDAGAVVGRVDYPNAEPSEFLQSVAVALGLGEAIEPWDVFGQVARLVAAAAAEGRRVVLIVEEAQSLAHDLLSEIGRLAAVERHRGGSGGFSILLVGGEGLEANLASPPHAALAAKVGVRHTLRPLAGDEIRDYVEHRLGMAGLGRDTFTPLALRLVGETAGGIPRLVNTLCDHALADATRQGLPVVNSELVQACIAEVGPQPSRPRRAIAAVAVPAALAPAPPGRETPRGSWTPGLVAAALAVGVLGLMVGYLVRGSRPDAGRTSRPAVTTPAPAAATVAAPRTADSPPPAPAGGEATEPPAQAPRAPAASSTAPHPVPAGSPPPAQASPESAPGAPSPAAPREAPPPRPPAPVVRAPAPAVDRRPTPPPDAAPAPAPARAPREPAAQVEVPRPAPTAARDVAAPVVAAPAAPVPVAGPTPARPTVGDRSDTGPDSTSIIDWLLREAPRRSD
jgi:general secretion pathway protein A